LYLVRTHAVNRQPNSLSPVLHFAAIQRSQSEQIKCERGFFSRRT
jgi:hypothetical protein